MICLTPSNGEHCPVKSLKKYIKKRGNKMGPLFIKSNKKPLTRTEFSCTLNDCLEIEGMPSDRITSSHSE